MPLTSIPRDFLPPVNTPGLTKSEITTIKAAHDCARNGLLSPNGSAAIEAALGIKHRTYVDRIRAITNKYRDSVAVAAVLRDGGAPSPSLLPGIGHRVIR